LIKYNKPEIECIVLRKSYKYMQENAEYGKCDVPVLSPPPPAAAPPVAVEKKAEPPTEEELHVDTPLKLLKFLWVT